MAGDFEVRGAGTENDRVAGVDQGGRGGADAPLLVDELRGFLAEARLVGATGDQQRAAVDTPHQAFGLETLEIPPDGHFRGRQVGCEIAHHDAARRSQAFKDMLAANRSRCRIVRICARLNGARDHVCADRIALEHALSSLVAGQCARTVLNARLPLIWHGGDYNPEQWPPETWDEDVALMQVSHFRVATVGVFSWVSLQPDEDRFTFEWLDRVVEKLHRPARYVCLATPTAAQPAWMSQALSRCAARRCRRQAAAPRPRVNYCPNSPNYRRFARQIASKLAERYAEHPALLAWHVSNEYGGQCFCDTCAAAFRPGYSTRYAVLEDLNQRWWTAFWGHTYTRVGADRAALRKRGALTAGLSIDYKRFQSESMLDCFKLERDAIRQFSSRGAGHHQPDGHLPAPGLSRVGQRDGRDLVGLLPVAECARWRHRLPARPQPWSEGRTAVHADGADAQQSELAADQRVEAHLGCCACGATWPWRTAPKRVMYFQWRRGRGGSEKFHGAVVEHGRRNDTRVFREVSRAGAELERLGQATLGATTPARVAILFDWNNWWAIENAVGPIQDKAYVATVRRYYRAFWRRNVAVDVVFSDSDLSRYDVVVAPMLHMVKQGVAERVSGLLEKGGTFVTTVFSGVVDETDLAFEGYPGPLRPFLGIWIEEIDALYPDQTNRLVMSDGTGEFACTRWCERVRLEGASVVATFGDSFFRGEPAVTRNDHAYYIATEPSDEFLDAFFGQILAGLRHSRGNRNSPWG